MEAFRLDGYSALVTGAGSGIGAATAVAMAEAGAAALILSGRDGAKLSHTAALIKAVAPACLVESVAGDLTVSVDRERLVNAVGAHGKLDTLVNNAGVFLGASLAETTESVWQRSFDLNAAVPLFLIRDLQDWLGRSRHASVVNISSTLAVKPIPGASAYNASKAALGQMTRSLALELGAIRIRVNAVLPAIVDTPMYRGRYQDTASYEASLPTVDGLHPLGRRGQPQDIAHAVVFLASPAASWITGVELPVDGGMLVS